MLKLNEFKSYGVVKNEDNSNTTLVKVKFATASNLLMPACIQIQHLLKLNP